jgi:hypothetical protein
MEWRVISPVAESYSNYWGVRKIVYYPGLVCSKWRRHTDRSAEITHAFILVDGRILGPKCLEFELAQSVVTTAVDSKHWMPRHWNDDTRNKWRERTAKKYWKVVRLCGLINQIKILAGYGTQHNWDVLLTTREKDLTLKQKNKLIRNLWSWGINRDNDFDTEVDILIRKLTQWRNQAFRVWVTENVIAPYVGQDQDPLMYMTYDEMQEVLKSFRKRLKNKPLTEKQNRYLLSIEGQLITERIQFTKFQCDHIINKS